MLNSPCCPTGFYFKNKTLESRNEMQKQFLTFGHFFSKCTFWRLIFFICLARIQPSQFYDWQFKCIRFMFFMKYQLFLG